MSGSRVSSNHCGNQGGGLYLSGGEEISASDLEVSGNKGIYGAGVFMDKKNTSLSGLVVKNNLSTKEGGGLYIENEKCSISNCEFTENTATTDGGVVSNAFLKTFDMYGGTISGNSVPADGFGGGVRCLSSKQR